MHLRSIFKIISWVKVSYGRSSTYMIQATTYLHTRKFVWSVLKRTSPAANSFYQTVQYQLLVALVGVEYLDIALPDTPKVIDIALIMYTHVVI